MFLSDFAFFCRVFRGSVEITISFFDRFPGLFPKKTRKGRTRAVLTVPVRVPMLVPGKTVPASGSGSQWAAKRASGKGPRQKTSKVVRNSFRHLNF